MRWLAAIPVVLLLGFGGLGLVQLFDGTKPDFERVSRAAPTATFAVLDGVGEHSFPSMAQEAPILVNLWATWCSPCKAEHPLLMSLSERYPGRVHGVLYEDAPEAARVFLHEWGNPFSTIALDPNGQLGLDFGLTGVPETFVIAPDGQIVLHLRGQLEPAHLTEIDSVMASLQPIAG